MKLRGFNPRQLVNRGVFDSLEELDRVMCELDDARREPRIIAVAWLEGFQFQVTISDRRVVSSAGLPMPHLIGGAPVRSFLPHEEVGETPNLRGYKMGDANRPKDRAGSGNKPLMRSLTADESRPLQGIAPQNFRQSQPVSGAESNTADPCQFTTGAPALPPVISPRPASDGLAMGQGSAPRCCSASTAPAGLELPASGLPTPARRDAVPSAPAAGFPLSGSSGDEPFHPVLNPNAGVRPAFPKGRWS